jgi:hypothetical protein
MFVKVTDEIQKAAHELINTGFSVVPFSISKKGDTWDKTARLSEWIALRTHPLTAHEFMQLAAQGHTRNGTLELTPGVSINGIAIICGKPSGCLEAIDVDTKNDKSGKLWETLSISIQTDPILEGIYKELIIERSVSGGYHIIYKAPDLPAAKVVLAHNEDKDELIAQHGAEKTLIIVPPTEGYTKVQNALTDDIPILTTQERDRLLQICRELDQSPAKPAAPPAPRLRLPSDTFNPEGKRAHEAEDYNHQTTTEGLSQLLQEHGWSVASRRGPNRDIIRMKRPGGTSADSAQITPKGTAYENGTRHTEITFFYVFSTSASPFGQRAYTPFQVYQTLEHGGNYGAAIAALKAKGYGAQTFTDIPQELGREVVLTDTPARLQSLRELGYKAVLCQGPINEAQAADLTARGVLNFTLCLENIPDVYAVFAPIIKAGGCPYLAAEPTKISIDRAKPHYRYFLDSVLSVYPLTEADADKNATLVTDEIVRYGGRLGALDRDKLIGEAISVLAPFGITKQTLEQAAAEMRAIERQKQQDAELAQGLEIAQGMMQNGKGAEALALLDTLGRTLRIKAQEVNADTLIAIDTEDSIREILAKSKKDIETGYKVRYDDMEVNGPGTGRKPEALSLPSGALTIIAARTSHRKTGLMLNMALNIAQRNREDVPGDVYFLTYEEDAAELYVKALNIYIDADLDHNNLDYIRSYYRKSHQNRDSDVFMTRKESFYHDLVTTGRLKIKGLDGTFTSTTLAAAVDNMMRVAKPAPAVLFVDYIQLIGTDRDIENRQAKLAQVCTELRELAKRVGIPVVLGAQFNRQVGQEGDIESSKIREAGDIEHEANLVIGLWDRAFTREGKTETKNGKQTTTGGHLDRNGNPAKKQPGTLYVEVLKGRNIGTGGYAELTYNPKTGKIYPYVADGGHGLGAHSNPNKPLSKHDKARG